VPDYYQPQPRLGAKPHAVNNGEAWVPKR
jgi:hypothetical protein